MNRTGMATRAELVARRVRGGYAAEQSAVLLAELLGAHTGANLAHVLEYQGFLTPAAAERFAGVTA